MTFSHHHRRRRRPRFMPTIKRDFTNVYKHGHGRSSPYKNTRPSSVLLFQGGAAALMGLKNMKTRNPIRVHHHSSSWLIGEWVGIILTPSSLLLYATILSPQTRPPKPHTQYNVRIIILQVRVKQSVSLDCGAWLMLPLLLLLLLCTFVCAPPPPPSKGRRR